MASWYGQGSDQPSSGFHYNNNNNQNNFDKAISLEESFSGGGSGDQGDAQRARLPHPAMDRGFQQQQQSFHDSRRPQINGGQLHPFSNGRSINRPQANLSGGGMGNTIHQTPRSPNGNQGLFGTSTFPPSVGYGGLQTPTMGSLQDYQSYQNSLSGLRDTSANLGYSTPDQVRRGVEALQNVQGTAQVSQQQLAGQPYGMSYGLTGQNYVYSPPSMTPGYHPYSNNPQMYTTPAANISGGYSKGTNTGLSNSYSSSYGQDLAVGDKLQNSAAYVAGNVSAFSNDPYMRSQGMLAGGSDLQGGYAYGASKTNNKSYEKPSQSYGMEISNQPMATPCQYNNQYSPMAYPHQLYHLTQGMPPNLDPNPLTPVVVDKLSNVELTRRHLTPLESMEKMWRDIPHYSPVSSPGSPPRCE
ncbi:hypothetical protein RvY_13554 [Ramazzottius varieornatus]|uniref:Uncharacterized protein n=1 Tax=Ramazzottius varieornatus TaxID=947166 RepID=A0A1D1VN88_RAMVA|nr:hypothetical protein RvY_13554 [Ramazzottius varieornatus]